jgi:hypothetical protein
MNAPEPDTVRIFIPLQIKRRNGRPRIVPPEHIEQTQARQQPHVLRAIARAWGWRRQLERGEVTTIHDIAAREKVSDRFVGRMLRLAYLSPPVLEQIVLCRRICAVSIANLSATAELPWSAQPKIVFEE